MPLDFASLVVRWQQQHGRQHLPWQGTRDPYRVWLSEIMLQQTQVSTVLGYYERFLQRFPDVQALAAAPADDVLALWSGLGYYSRARNLHRCAQAVVAEHGGQFPPSAQALEQLPGIGRSTAAAIAAFCFGERAAILDANVRRVLTRVLGFADDLAQARHERALWQHAHALLPSTDLAHSMARYTQGLMDVGAQVCLPRQPLCSQCPVQPLCVAHAQGTPERYPVKSRRLQRRAERWWLLLWRNPQGAWWLQRRPAPGIWAGLHCPPVCDSEAALAEVLAQLPAPVAAQAQYLTPFVHVLTHRDLHLHPVLLSAPDTPAPVGAPQALPGQWATAAQCAALGLPAPVRKLLDAWTETSLFAPE